MSKISTWLVDNFEEGNSRTFIRKDLMYDAYYQFSINNGLHIYAKNIFFKIVFKKFPFIKNHRLGPRGKGVPYISGIKTKNNIIPMKIKIINKNSKYYKDYINDKKYCEKCVDLKCMNREEKILESKNENKNDSISDAAIGLIKLCKE